MDETLGTTTQDQSEFGSNSNKGVLQSSHAKASPGTV